MSRFITYIAVLVVFACTWGCDEEPKSDVPMSTGGCISDLDCGSGLVCIRSSDESGGACRSGECNRERACRAGFVCDVERRTCIADSAIPCSDGVCPEGMVCESESSRCVDADGQTCSGHVDCPQGLCLNGHCRPIECSIDAHCHPDETCLNERCEAIIQGCDDLDGDGYGMGAACIAEDCDDRDPNVNAGAVENSDVLCSDGIDHDCDGTDPICGDFDQDGDGYTVDDGDCDDERADVNPARSETPYNGRDDDCDPFTSDDDVDGDGFRAQLQGGRDCDDSNPAVNPDADEIQGNGVDEDCDGIDENPTADDRDGDGFSERMGDCDDDNPTVHPSTNEVPYNGRDDDCNPATTDDDIDEDGFRLAEDCDDHDPHVNPGRREFFYNGIDDDCNPETVDNDADGDGYRASDVMGSDCNDRSSSVNSNAVEVPYNGIDDDCDPETPDDDIDADGVMLADDCDDNDSEVNPNVIENSRDNCGDGIDNNCRAGDVPCDPMASDRDGDGVPDDMDCEPLDPNVPGIREVLNNGIDDDCNPRTADLLNQCFDDEFDVQSSNHNFARATEVIDGNTRGIQYPGLVLCPHDEDWYRIPVLESDGLEFDVFFDATEGNLDLALFEMGEDNVLIPIDTSQGDTGHESVFVRRHGGGPGEYYLRVYRFVPSDQPTPYGLTTTTLERCADDHAGPYGEQNDTSMTAVELPPPGMARQICPYDDDWYRLNVERRRQVALHLLFDHSSGDLDLGLYDAEGQRLSTSVTVTDDELISLQLDAGTYFARVYGFQSDQNQYHFVKALEPTRRVRARIEDPIQLNDYRRGLMGTIDIPLTILAPEGARIRRLYIRDLQIQHSFLNDLRLVGVWNGEPRAVFWNHDGVYGFDGGLDDDELPFTSQDINFDQRSYSEFSGLLANGEFVLRVEDWVEGDSGLLTDLEVEVEYFLPERDLP